MSQSLSVWFVVVFALVAANLPFLSERLMMVVTLASPKNLGIRLAELVLYYLLAGALGLLLEKRAGQIAAQTWEFYTITAALFITFAFPGFIYRYLFKNRS